MRIFDAHTHAFPTKIAATTMAKLSSHANIPHYHDGSFAGLAAYEKAGGAEGFLLLPIATKAKSVRSINEWVAAKCGGGAYAFGTLYPGMEDFEEAIAHIQALGMRGVKMHPEYQSFFVDDESLFPMYAALFDAGLALYLHAGRDEGFGEPVHGDVRRIARLADAFPRGKIIAAHMGGLYQEDLVLGHLAGRDNVWMDTSFAAQRMDSGRVREIIRAHGAHRFFFGTDAPWSDFKSAKDAVLNAGLTQKEMDAIFWDNAAAILVNTPKTV